MGILLTILKIIGILLLILLGLVLLILLVVLFVPFRYIVGAENIPGGVEAEASVGWLFGAVKVILSFRFEKGGERKLTKDIRIFGISLFGLRDWLKNRKKRKAQKAYEKRKEERIRRLERLKREDPEAYERERQMALERRRARHAAEAAARQEALALSDKAEGGETPASGGTGAEGAAETEGSTLAETPASGGASAEGTAATERSALAEEAGKNGKGTQEKEIVSEEAGVSNSEGALEEGSGAFGSQNLDQSGNPDGSAGSEEGAPAEPSGGTETAINGDSGSEESGPAESAINGDSGSEESGPAESAINGDSGPEEPASAESEIAGEPGSEELGPAQIAEELVSPEEPERVPRSRLGKLLSRLGGLMDRLVGILIRALVFLINLPSKLVLRIVRAFGKLSRSLAKIRRIKNFITDYRTRAFIRQVMITIRKLLGHAFPRRVSGHLRFGFADPSWTGIATGAISWIYPKFRGRFRLEPVFDETVFDGEIRLKGRIFLFYPIYLAVRLIFNKNTKYVISFLKKFNSKKEDPQ